MRDYETISGSLDWREARGMEGRLSWGYLAGRTIKDVIHPLLEARAEQLVAANWTVIERLAAELLRKEWEPKKALKSGAEWSNAELAKYLFGDEIVEVLSGLDINATCVEEC